MEWKWKESENWILKINRQRHIQIQYLSNCTAVPRSGFLGLNTEYSALCFFFCFFSTSRGTKDFLVKMWMSSERCNSTLLRMSWNSGALCFLFVFLANTIQTCKQCFSSGTIFSSGLIHDLCPSERDKYKWDWLKLNLSAYIRDSERVNLRDDLRQCQMIGRDHVVGLQTEHVMTIHV